MKAALIVVDVQNDFVTGSLPVPGAKDAMVKINHLIKEFESKDHPIFFSKDFHPAEHCSFVSQGGSWPAHCVVGSRGADLADGLDVPLGGKVIVFKGTSEHIDAYSAFDGTALDALLKGRGVDTVLVVGLATDFCVRATVLDACRLGYSVLVPVEGIAGVTKAGVERSVHDMLRAGALLVV